MAVTPFTSPTISTPLAAETVLPAHGPVETLKPTDAAWWSPLLRAGLGPIAWPEVRPSG